jgi:glutamate transport system permease protein
MSNVLFDAPGPKAVLRHRLIGAATVLAIIAVIVVVVLKLSSAGQFDYAIWEPFVTPSIIEILLEGLRYVLQTAVIAIAGAFAFGLVFGVGKLSDHAWVRWPSWLVVEFFRAVPLLMLIIFLWSIEGFPLGSLRPLIIGLILYNGSVLAEVFRAGINALPAGQSEAAYALGMRKNQVVRIIELPQAIKIMLPSITSQCIVALKDTSLGFYILAPGLLFAGREIYRTFDNRFATAVVLAAVYIVLNLLLTRLFQLLQRRFGGESQAGKDAEQPVTGAQENTGATV